MSQAPSTNKLSLGALLAWIVSLVATAGSLFFSEVMELPPCVLCWYQRIAMYPLVVVIGISLIRGDISGIRPHVLTLATVGFFIALYHNLLYFGIIPDSITPCSQGVSCTSLQIEWLGFITIPLMSITAFTMILSCFGFKFLGRKTI